MNIKILVATHKSYEMPKDTNLYLPILVGKDLHPDVNHVFQGDNTGDNISKKNGSYNELTALYWAWKNLDADAIGLVHYRRYFGMKNSKSIDDILTKEQTEKLLSQADVIVPKKRHYWIETNYSHYVHAHPKISLDLARQVISQKYPAYLEAFDVNMKKTSAHIFNMFIMQDKDFQKYCTWVFDVLSEIEKQLDTTGYSKYQSRVYGFVSERLLDVWLETNKKNIVEVPVIFLENQHWAKKIVSFIVRKFGGKQQ